MDAIRPRTEEIVRRPRTAGAQTKTKANAKVLVVHGSPAAAASVDKSNKFKMEYKVIPSTASADQKRPVSETAAEQLQTVINKLAEQGWSYVRVESITT